MADIHDLNNWRDEKRQSLTPNLKSGGGGGTFDGMETRVTKLETDMAYIKGKLEDMPTKDWMNTRLMALIALFIVASGLIQWVAEIASKAPTP